MRNVVRMRTRGVAEKTCATGTGLRAHFICGQIKLYTYYIVYTTLMHCVFNVIAINRLVRDASAHNTLAREPLQ